MKLIVLMQWNFVNGYTSGWSLRYEYFSIIDPTTLKLTVKLDAGKHD